MRIADLLKGQSGFADFVPPHFRRPATDFSDSDDRTLRPAMDHVAAEFCAPGYAVEQTVVPGMRS